MPRRWKRDDSCLLPMAFTCLVNRLRTLFNWVQFTGRPRHAAICTIGRYTSGPESRTSRSARNTLPYRLAIHRRPLEVTLRDDAQTHQKRGSLACFAGPSEPDILRCSDNSHKATRDVADSTYFRYGCCASFRAGPDHYWGGLL